MVLTLKRTVSTLALATLAIQGTYTIGAVYLNSIKYAITPGVTRDAIPLNEVISPNEPIVKNAPLPAEEVLKSKSLALSIEESVPEQAAPRVATVVPSAQQDWQNQNDEIVIEQKDEMPEAVKPSQEEVAAAVVQPQLKNEEVDVSSQVYVIKKADTLSKIWKELGAPYAHSLKAADAFKKAGISLGLIREGREIKYISNDGVVVFADFALPAGKHLILRWNDGAYVSELSELETRKVRTSAAGTIYGSLASAASSHDIPFSVIDELAEVFSSKVEFTKDLRDGDTFSLVYDETLRGEEAINTELVSASLFVNGRRQFAIEYTGEDGKRRFFDENGTPMGSYFLKYPVVFSRISSVFSDSRLHPIVGIRRPHNGVDFAAPTGTPVRCIGDGKVVAAGYGRANGRYVTVAHANGFQSTYLHLSAITSGVHAGSHVTRGQLIGKVGQTGLATGPHLHFGVFKNGHYVDPMRTNLPSPPVGKGNSVPRDLLMASLSQHDSRHQALASISLSGAKPNLPS